MNKQMSFIVNEALGVSSQECLAWPYERNWKGYGRFREGGRRAGAHRVVCAMAHGQSPSDKHVVAHSCGNGHLACVNPAHLRWATNKENHADKLIHGTLARGSRNGNSRLDEETARKVKRMLLCMVQREIAESLGITRSAVRDIKIGRTWAWL